MQGTTAPALMTFRRPEPVRSHFSVSNNEWTPQIARFVVITTIPFYIDILSVEISLFRKEKKNTVKYIIFLQPERIIFEISIIEPFENRPRNVLYI